jgi:hypothetical protein
VMWICVCWKLLLKYLTILKGTGPMGLPKQHIDIQLKYCCMMPTLHVVIEVNPLSGYGSKKIHCYHETNI